MPSNLKTLLTEDSPIQLNAAYQFNATDRRYLDDQALAAQQHIVDSLISGITGTWFNLSGGSVSVVAGDCVCVSAEPPAQNGIPIVTKANATTLAAAGGVCGVVLQTASPNTRVRVAIVGVVAQAVTGLPNTAGLVRCNPLTGRTQQVSVLGSSDFAVGTVTNLGVLTLYPGSQAPVGGGVAAPSNCTTLEAYGAIGDGVTDDTTAYVNALASGKTILLGAKTYLVNGTGANWAIGQVATTGQSIIGVGDNSVLKTTSNYAILDLAVASGGLNIFANFRLLGNNTGTSQHGFTCGHDNAVQCQSRYILHNITAENCGGRGFSIEYTLISFVGPRISNCFAYSNTYAGFYSAVADYVVFTNCVAAYNGTYGVYCSSGNNHWNGGSIVANGTGVLIDAGGNDSHGVFAGCAINHNTIAVQVNAIANGEIFEACDIYYGTIVTTGSTGVRFRGCTIDVTSLTCASSTRFEGCSWPMANANTVSGAPYFDPNNTTLNGQGF